MILVGRAIIYGRRRSAATVRRYCDNNIIVVPWSNEKTRKIKHSPRLPLNGSIVINFVISRRWAAKEIKKKTVITKAVLAEGTTIIIISMYLYSVFVFCSLLQFLIKRWLWGPRTNNTRVSSVSTAGHNNNAPSTRVPPIWSFGVRDIWMYNIILHLYYAFHYFEIYIYYYSK